MATATTARPTDRHPWIDAFVADPAAELDNLLAGHASIAPYESADAPDATRLLFGGLPDDDEALGALDRAVNEWLDSQRLGGVPEIDPLSLERWVRKVSEAFEIIGLLKLTHCSSDLRKRYVVWNSWADRLAVSAQRDGRHAFLRTLALTQRIVAEAESTVNPFALESLWLHVCEQAGTGFPEHYLGVGLIGLRMLPEREGAPSERPWMAGLVRWAVGQKPPAKAFSRHWWALKALYPRMPSYWRSALTETLQQSSAEQMLSELKDWWLQDVAVNEGTIAEKPESQSVSVPEMPSPSDRISVLRRTSNPFASIKDQIEALTLGYRRYAEATGDSYYFIRTACNVGMAVIKGADDPVGRGRFAADLAQQALAWQPAHVYAWALWRNALAKQGAFDAAELVGWESIRRFPENEQWRNQLALLLADFSDREADAEYLLRETIERFPGDVVARTQLAELLIALDRIDEATSVVDDIFSRQLENEVGFDLRARLLDNSGDREAARNVLLSGLGRFSTNRFLQAHIRMLDEGRALPLKAAAYRHHAKIADAAGVLSAPIRQRGHLRRLFSECRRRADDDDWRNTALEEVRRVLSEDTNLAYAQYLRRELEGGDGNGSPAGSFAVAFIDALKRKDAARLSALEKSFSGQTHFIDVAKVFLFGDRAAADRAFNWFTQEVRSEARTVSALRGFLNLRIHSSVESSEAFVNLVAGNDNIQTDLIESVLAGDELLLAA